MARFYGAVGYATSNETSPGVWEDSIVERIYGGDIIRNARRWVNGEKLNEDLTINNEISILADPFAYDNFHTIKYVKWMGTNWKVTNISILRPRIILTLGGVFNV